MIILLTNDDGIDCPGIQSLAAALRTARPSDRVLVLAPDGDRSGASHSLGFMREPIRVRARGGDDWSCSGNPVDCVTVGLTGALGAQPDVVLSGINKGANLGTDIIFSGTAAAARHGALLGFPAAAFSLERTDRSPWLWDDAARWAAGHLDDMLAILTGEGLVGKRFINVNMPNVAEPGPARRSFPAVRTYHDGLESYRSPRGDDYFFVRFGEITSEEAEGSDCDTVSRNMVAVTAVHAQPEGD